MYVLSFDKQTFYFQYVYLFSEGFGAFPFAIPFSRIPSPCVCSQQYCTCCANIDLQPFALNQRGNIKLIIY